MLNTIFLLKRWDGITSMQHFYSQKKNSIDVIFLGSSTSGTNFNMETLYREYGIAGYNLWSSGQPLANTYYYLKEALKYQTPKLFVLEMGSVHTESFGGPHPVINTQGLKFSIDFIKNITVTTIPYEWHHLLFGMSTFHTRFKELTKYDFQQFPWNDNSNDKGNFSYIRNYVPLDTSDVSAIKEIQNISSKNEKYLNAIIDLCKTKNIPILLVACPRNDKTFLQPYFNYISDFSERKNIPFINFNLLNEDLKLTTSDTRDGAHHNIKGAKKITLYLGKYIKENYNIPDRRNTGNDYESWEINAHVMENKYLHNIYDIDEYISFLKDIKRNIYIVKANMSNSTEYYNTISKYLSELSANTLFKNTSDNEIVFIQNQDLTNESITISSEGSLKIYKSGSLIIHNDSTGIFFIVYDTYTDEIADIAFLPENDFYKIQHLLNSKADVIRFNFEYM